MRKVKKGSSGILFGVLWNLVAWLVFVTSYQGFLARAASFPLQVGFWLSESFIAPYSIVLASYLNAFVLSVPVALLSGWLLTKGLSKLIQFCRAHIVLFKLKRNRKLNNRYVFSRKKKVG